MAKQVKPKIGLEIHGYLQTNEKLFCRCKAVRHSKKQEIKPNTYICPICTGQPGSKPMLPNAEAIKKLIQISLILNCKINTAEKNKKLVWNRKHYNWPDLPKGYQDTISGAYSVPVSENGGFENIRIRECHLEEDPAAWNPQTGCIDYNRSGLPLVEIVTEPDFKNANEVELWLKQLLLSLSYIKAVDKNAGIKSDVNVSVNNGERVEIKNVSSITDIKNAIEHEIARQSLEKAKRETRRWDSNKGKTILMRTKETQADYRFIPDPDLPIIKLTNKETKEIGNNLPETPNEKLDKLIKKHGINKKQAEILYKNIDLVEFFEKVSEKINPEFALDWVTIELLRVLNYNNTTIEEIDIKVEHFIKLLNLVQKEKITPEQAKKTLNDFYPKSFDAEKKLKGKEKISDKSKLEDIVKKVIKDNNQASQDYQNGEEKSLNFLIGQVMKQTKGRADVKIVKKLIEKKLK